MTTIFEFQARKTQRIAAALAHFVSTTPPDHLEWCPATEAASQTRSVLAMISECIGVNRYTAALLRGETPEIPGSTAAPAATFTDGDDAQQQLIASGEELAAAVGALDDDALTRTYHHWRGDFAGELVIEMAYRNMAYHAGQVNMVQLLAGDTQFHIPPTWL